MFPSNKETPADNLDTVINRHLAAMKDMDPRTSTDYPEMVKHLDTLYSLRNANAPKPMSTGEKATIAANIAGIILVLKHEQLGVITSKAFGLISKLR